MDYKKELSKFIDILVKEGGSDLHLVSGSGPTIRVSGGLVPLLKEKKLTGDDTLGLISILLTPEQKEYFLKTREIDFSYTHEAIRFRGSGYFQQGTAAVALRLVPKNIKTIAELNLPSILETFTEREQGFFLVVGPVGQGKSTTLAALINLINEKRTEHIVTIEDPIEYVFENKRSLIDQREVRIDTRSFESGLRSVVRQDVDVIMIGEMRDIETMSAAVTAAETGHLVFSTLHTNNAAQTIDRIIDAFPPSQQEQIRMQLSSSLAGVFSQRLVPRVSGGLIPAYELMINNKAIANLIREKRTHEINIVIETGLEEGMIDMNRHLADLVRRGEITVESAYARSLNSQALDRLL